MSLLDLAIRKPVVTLIKPTVIVYARIQIDIMLIHNCESVFVGVRRPQNIKSLKALEGIQKAYYI